MLKVVVLATNLDVVSMSLRIVQSMLTPPLSGSIPERARLQNLSTTSQQGKHKHKRMGVS
jgi:hypothetical protein